MEGLHDFDAARWDHEPTLRVRAKTSTGQEAYFEQNDPHPDPLPSDGRGNRQPRLSQLPKRLDTPTGGGRFSLSHPMGEGRGEGERASKSEVVFARVLSGLCSFRVEQEPTARTENERSKQPVRPAPDNPWLVTESE